MANAKDTLKGVLPRPARSSDAFQTELVNTLEAHLEARIVEARDAANRAADDAVFAGQVVVESIGAVERTVARLAAAVAELEVGPTPEERLRRRVLPALAARTIADLGANAVVLDLSPDRGDVAAALAVLGHAVVRAGPLGPLAALAGVGGTTTEAADVVLVAAPSAEEVVLALLRSAGLVPAAAPLVLLADAPDPEADDPLAVGAATPDEVRALLAGRQASVAVHPIGARAIRSVVLSAAPT